MVRNVLHDPVLVLNKSWLPVDTCTVKRAFSRLFDEKARFMDTYGEGFVLHDVMSWLELPVFADTPAITTSRFSIRAPEVIVLTESEHVQKRRVMQFSRRNLARRDRMTCQYCGKGRGQAAMTIDHVDPKSKGGKSTWENCVLSCLDCNSKKKDHSLDEVNLKLMVRPEIKKAFPHNPDRWTKPYAPSWSPIFRIANNKIKESWKNFLDSKLLEI